MDLKCALLDKQTTEKERKEVEHIMEDSKQNTPNYPVVLPQFPLVRKLLFIYLFISALINSVTSLYRYDVALMPKPNYLEIYV